VSGCRYLVETRELPVSVSWGPAPPLLERKDKDFSYFLFYVLVASCWTLQLREVLDMKSKIRIIIRKKGKKEKRKKGKS